MNFETFRSRVTVFALAAFALGGVVLAQGGGGQKPQGGGGRPGGGAPGPMLIDFTAVGADGKAITDLAPADVSIKIGGKARTVSSLELKKVSSGAAPAAATTAAAPAAAAGDLTPPFVTNEAVAAAAPTPAASGAVNRTVLIIVDTESLTPGSEAMMKSAINGLIDGLSPGDKVALSTAPNDTAAIGLGTSLSKVKEAVNALKGQRPASISSADLLCRTARTLGLVSGLVQQLAASPTPSSVVFVARDLSTKDRASGSTGTCEVVDDDYNRVRDAAAEARANVYVVQGDQSVMGRNDGLEQLAGVTGAGTVMRVTGDGIAPRILGESGAYWLATLAPDPADRPGQAQRLEIASAKAGVTIHARGFAAPSRAAMAGPGAGPAAPKGAASPKDMIGSQAQYTDLQLRAAAIVQRGKGETMTAIIQAEPVDPTVKITAMRVGFFDASNKGGSTDAPQVATFPITTVMALGPGQYRVRVAATDSTGKSGAVDVSVNTTLATAGPLKMSGLLIGAPQGEAGIKPQLTFSNEPEVRVFFEMYGQITAGISAKFELAASDNGPAKDTFQVAGGGATNEPDKFNVFGKIPIDKLPPGDYVVRAIVQMEGQPEGKVMRTFRKVGK